MSGQSRPKSVDEILDRFKEVAKDEKRVSLNMLMDAVGRRSFGPLILFAGIVLLVPGVSDIPGVSTLIGIYVLLVAGQLICGRSHFWLPQWLLDRCASETIKTTASNKWIRKLAKLVDRMVTRRLVPMPMQSGQWSFSFNEKVLP
ncbi:exopolysaccharide biosynthesis protein [Luteolibacter yonseiensis]|uniref:Exopolysaccharide biosynthesis protein n=1 Tax=Luteolibacter yonseiensis TaxID=1144680 RepID=A0A934R6T4_9BACT|nr:exopolysaccharide biosynthesis protein [Luteolibacter yonseiensis]MBK1818067.1 exopolysaccharide biosynthesis protein [Luteolibacter yonseiensis]